MELNNTTHNQESPSELEELSNTKRPELLALDLITAYRGETVTRRTNAPMQPTTLLDIIDEIRNSVNLAATIQKIRTLDIEDKEEKKDKQNEIKKYELPYFTLGRFQNQYLINENFLGTKFIITDYDGLGQSLPEVRANFLTDPYAFIITVSPSGQGLKVIYELDREIKDPDRYIALYKRYGAEKGKAHGAELDEVTHNPGRACFLTSDPDIYVNPDRLLLPTDIELDEIIKKKSISRPKLIEAIKGVETGHRNDRLLRVTCALIDSGVDEEVAIELMIGMNLRNTPPLQETELIRTVKHAYITYPHPANLKREFIYIQKDLQKKKAEPVAIAKVYFDWLKENRKARFFTDEQINHYVYLNNRLIQIDEHESDFESLLLKTANISTATPLGRVLTQVVGASAHFEGKKIQKSTWLQTNLESLTVYLNLKNERNELLSISASGCNVIQNGRNDADVFMLNMLEDKISPISYIHQSEAEIAETMRLAESNIIAHIPSEEEDRWFAYAWRMSYPLFDLTTAHIIVRFQGGSEQGKTTASRLLSYSLYGKDFTDKSTVASMYSDASINPLILDDNLESKNFADPGRSDFYLGAATGGGRQKRDQSSGSGLINEKTRALVLCNGIESIAKSEHTSRMMIMQCDRSLHGSNYSSAVLLDLKRNRNRLLSVEYDISKSPMSNC